MMTGEDNSRWAKLRDWWNERTEGQRDAWRFGGAALALAVLGTAGYLFVKPWWAGRQHREALAQAEEFGARQEYREMLLALRRATELAPSDLTTWREVAHRLREIGSPEVLRAQRNLVELAPQDISLRLALVSEALRFGEVDLARQELGAIDAAAQRDAAFHRLAASLALALGRADELEAALTALVAADPKDGEARFNLAALQVWGADPVKAAAALRELEALTSVAEVRVRAALELLKHAARQRDLKRVEQLVTLLLQRLSPTGAPATPRGDPPGWQQLVDALKAAAAPSAADCALTARWLADVRLERDALLWIEGMPEAMRRHPELLDVAAELSARIGDTIRLGFLLRAGAWDGMPDDAITLAFAARIQRERGQLERAAGTWADAIAASTPSASGLRNLSRLAGTWGDTAGSEQALFALIGRWPRTWWAYDTLRTSAAARGDVATLWRVYDAWTRARPESRDLALEWIRLSSLVDHAGPEALAKARQLQAATPEDPAARTALAAALWRARQLDHALALAQPASPQSPRTPDSSFWETLILADLGRKTEAAAALARAWRRDLPAVQLDLLRAAAAKVGVATP